MMSVTCFSASGRELLFHASMHQQVVDDIAGRERLVSPSLYFPRNFLDDSRCFLGGEHLDQWSLHRHGSFPMVAFLIGSDAQLWMCLVSIPHCTKLNTLGFRPTSLLAHATMSRQAVTDCAGSKRLVPLLKLFPYFIHDLS